MLFSVFHTQFLDSSPSTEKEVRRWEKGGCMCAFFMNCPIVYSGGDALALALGRNTRLPAQFERALRLQMRRTGF